MFSDSQRCCIEILTTFPTAWTSQNRAGHSWQPKKMLRKVSVRNWKFMEGKSQELAKPRSSFTISRQRSSSSYWSCVTFVSYTAARFEATLFHDMPITGVRSNVIEVAQLCTKYVNTASEVKFHVQSSTDEGKNKAPLWKPVEARKIGLKSAQPQRPFLTICAKRTVEIETEQLQKRVLHSPLRKSKWLWCP